MPRTARFPFFVLTAGLFLLAPGLTAQEIVRPNAQLTYQTEKKGEAEAALIEALVPVLGHAYAGDARRGLLPAGISVGGLVLMIAGAANLDTGMTALGSLGYLGGRVWGIVSAYQTAKDHNTILRQKLSISVGPGTDAGGVGFTFAISTR